MEKSGIVFERNNNYLYHLHDDIYEIKILTKRGDIAEVDLYYNDKYQNNNGVLLRPCSCVHLQKTFVTTTHDVFVGRFFFDEVAICCFFAIKDQNGREVFYGAYQFFDEMIDNPDKMFDGVPYLLKQNTFDFPTWSQGLKMYQIFAERFAPTEKECLSWRMPQGFFGSLNGTLKGIEKKLGYLKDLGIEALYLTPICKSKSNHRYDIDDYMEVDPRLGSNADLISLVESAHKNNVKIILDFVFNHTSPYFFAFQDILKNQEKSIYKDWYLIDKFPIVVKTNPDYKCFSRVPHMPKLNTANSEVQDYLLKITEHYVKNIRIDGIRLDVADELDLTFLRRLRTKVKSLNKEAMIYGEIWFESAAYLNGDLFDSVMNYQFYNQIYDLLDGKCNGETFGDHIDFMYSRFHSDVHDELLNLISSHDTERLMSHVRGDRQLIKIGFTIMYLIKGSTMLYYGEENGLGGENHEDNRRGMIFDAHPFITPLIKKLQVLKEIGAFRRGDYRRIQSEDKNIYMFQRSTDTERYLVIANMGSSDYLLDCVGYDLLSDKDVDKVPGKDIVAVKIK